MSSQKKDYEKLKEVSKEFFPGGYLTQRSYVSFLQKVADKNEMGSMGRNKFFGRGVLIEYSPTPISEWRKPDKGLEVVVSATSLEAIPLARSVADEINKIRSPKKIKRPKTDTIVYRRRHSNSGEELF